MNERTTLAVIGDVHARMSYLDDVVRRIKSVRVDGILLVGDLGSDDLSFASLRTPERDALYLASVAGVLDAVATVGVPVRYVPGNHDLPDLDLPGNVDRRVDTVAGLRIGGIGGAGPARFGFCYEWDDDAIRARPPLDCDVLLVHCPPADTPLDDVHGRSTGSEAIRERALAHTGFLVCGHIHESSSAIQLGDCLCMNVGGLGEPWGRPQVGFIRRGPAGDEAWHEDLETDAVRRWRRISPR